MFVTHARDFPRYKYLYTLRVVANSQKPSGVLKMISNSVEEIELYTYLVPKF